MEDQKYIFVGKIVSATTTTMNDMAGDSILVEFTFNGAKTTSEFSSPFMNNAILKKWRQLVLSVVWDQKVKPTDASVETFDNYKNDLVGRSVNVAYVENEIIGIGKRPDYLFFPYEYGLGVNQPN